MTNFEDRSPFIRYPLVFLWGIYAFLIHPFVQIIFKIGGKIWAANLKSKIKRTAKLASEAYQNDRYEESIAQYLKCIELIPGVFKDQFSEYWVAMLHLGALYRLVGNLNEAEKYIDMGREEFDKYHLFHSHFLINEGDYLADKGLFIEAEQSYIEAYKFFENSPDSVEYRTVCYNLHHLYHQMGQYDRALEYLNKCGEADDMQVSISKAHQLINKGNYTEAEKELLKIKELFSKDDKKSPSYIILLTAFAEVYFRQKRYQESISAAEESLKYCEKVYGKTNSQYAANLSWVGLAQLKLGNPEHSRQSFEKSLRITEESSGKCSDDYLIALQNMATHEFSSGNIKACENRLIQSMDIYLELVKNNFKKMSIKKRLSISDKYFARQLNIYNYLSNNPNSSSDFVNKVLDFRLHTKHLLLEKAENSAMINNTFALIKSSLSADEIAIEVVRFLEIDERETGKSRYIFFIISNDTKTAPKVISVITSPEKEKSQHEAYLENVQLKSIDMDSYETFWSFLVPELEGRKTIFYSPDGIYRYINLCTFRTNTGQYILEQYDIRLMNDLRNIYSAKNNNPKIPKNALLLANPTYYDEEVFEFDKTIEKFLPPIPASEIEVQNISKVLNQELCETKILLGENVTKSEFENIEKYQLLHIATHGYFRKSFVDTANISAMMFKSGLFLAHPFYYSEDKGNLVLTENGYLSSEDILSMNLHQINLVVLSACKSGIDAIINSGDTFGFTRTFFTAGAQNLIISLWDVEDKITTEFMSIFYLLWSQDKNMVTAFHKTQLAIKKKYKHPLYWGGFVMYHR